MVSERVYVLLPPSESKKPGGDHVVAPGFFDESLGDARRAVLSALGAAEAAASAEEATRLLKVRGELLERARAATRLLVQGSAALMPAWQRYDGVVWTHLGPERLDEAALERVLIPSALYGLNRGTDLIAEYRLTFKVSLDPLGPLARYWREPLGRCLEGLAGVTLVDLLPKEHAAALADVGRVAKVERVPVHFRRADGDAVAGHDAKAAKGELARRILLEGLGAVGAFRWRGWRGRERGGVFEVRAPKTRAAS